MELNTTMNSDMTQYTQPTPIINYEHSSVSTFAKDNVGSSPDPRKQAINLYYAVRDGIRYDPYNVELTVEGLRASTTLKNGRAWCVSKAILLAGCCRLHGIPARLGFADVRNHLSTKRMREQMKTDVFRWHGYTSIYLDGNWIKATPAFNIELCEKFKLKPLDFDGQNDSIYHPFDLEGNRHMEYLKFRGEYPDVPIDKMEETFRKHYPSELSMKDADFDHDVEQETIENE
jgi:transglutaminase-like putative cysteine protease